MIDAARVAAVLLAAGRSTRFGGDKLVAALAGKPVALHAAEGLAAVGFGHLVAVTSDAFAGLFRGFEIVVNDRPEEGQARSLRLGVEAAERAGADAVLVALADMPFVGAAHYRRLLAAHERVTATALNGTAMPPALFGRALFLQLKALDGDRGARSLLAGATLIEAPPHELRDIDVPADLNRRPTPSR